MNSEYSNLWWAIEGVLGGMGIPYIDPERRLNGGGALRAHLDELLLLHRAGIRAVVCLLNIPGDAPVFQSAGFEFICLPVENGQPPTLTQAEEFLAFTDACRLRKQPVAVFCQAGVGRTSTLIACYLIRNGQTAAEAIASMRSKEASAVETPSQIIFLEQFEKMTRNPPASR